MVRLVTLWTSGVVSSGCFGAAIADFLYGHADKMASTGFIGGAAAFICARLWLTEANVMGNQRPPNLSDAA